MQRLIRLALLIMTRLALFMAVVATVLSQFRSVHCVVSYNKTTYYVSSSREEWRLSPVHVTLEMNTNVKLYTKAAKSETGTLWPPVFTSHWAGGTSYHIHHWLVVATGGLPYVLLRLICRTRLDSRFCKNDSRAADE